MNLSQTLVLAYFQTFSFFSLIMEMVLLSRPMQRFTRMMVMMT